MMTSDFISHKKLELKLIVYYYDESSLKETTLVVDAPELGGTPLSSIWLTTLNRANYVSWWPFSTRCTLNESMIESDCDWYILKGEGIVKVKNSLYLFRTG